MQPPPNGAVSGSLIIRFKPSADAAAHDKGARQVIEVALRDLWNHADDQESAVALCNDGAVELAVHALQLFLDDAQHYDNIVRYACGVLYNLSRSLPRKRPVRLKMMDAAAFALLPRMQASPIEKVRLYAALVSSHSTMAGLPREYRVPFPPESIRSLVSCFRATMDGDGYMGGYWSAEQISSTLQYPPM